MLYKLKQFGVSLTHVAAMYFLACHTCAQGAPIILLCSVLTLSVVCILLLSNKILDSDTIGLIHTSAAVIATLVECFILNSFRIPLLQILISMPILFAIMGIEETIKKADAEKTDAKKADAEKADAEKAAKKPSVRRIRSRRHAQRRRQRISRKMSS